MSFRPRRRAAIDATQKIEALELKPKKYGRPDPSEANSTRAPANEKATPKRKRRKRYALHTSSDEDYSDEDYEEDDIICEVDEADDPDFDFEYSKKRKRGTVKYYSPGDFASANNTVTIRKRTSLAVINKNGNYISISPKIKPHKIWKLDYEEEDSPLFDMDCEDFGDNDDYVNLDDNERRIKRVKLSKPVYHRAEGNVIFDLLMWCDSEENIYNFISTCFSDPLSFSQTQKYNFNITKVTAQSLLQSIPVNTGSQQPAISKAVTSSLPNVSGTSVIRLPVTGSNGQLMQLLLQLPMPQQRVNSSITNSSGAKTPVMINSGPNIFSQRIILPPNYRLANVNPATGTAPVSVTPLNSLFPNAITTNTIRPSNTFITKTPAPTTNPCQSLSTYGGAHRNMLSKQHKVNDFTDCVCVIQGNNANKTTSNIPSHLTVKPLPLNWPSTAQSLVQCLVKLDQTLVNERFKEYPGLWMIKHSLIKKPNCSLCCKQMSRVAVDKVNGGKLQLRWLCHQDCNGSAPTSLPAYFSKCLGTSSVSQLLFAIYYWTIQVDIASVLKKNDVNLETITNVWKLLRVVCCSKMENFFAENPMKQNVTLATAKLGGYYLIAAMASSSLIRLALFDDDDLRLRSLQPSTFALEVAKKWFLKDCLITVCEPYFLALNKQGFNVRLISRSDFLSKNLYVGYYLIHHLRTLFQNVNLSELNKAALTALLTELQWREKFGSDPNCAFTNIIHHLIEFENLKPVSIPPLLSSTTTPPVPTTPLTSIQKACTSVYMDEHYYGSLTIDDPYDCENDRSNPASIMCHLCKKSFDNVLLSRHFLEHIKNEGWCKAKHEKISKCEHCLRNFTTNILPLHSQLFEMKMQRFACRICCLPLLDREKYLLHMTKSHFKLEMPYCCSICCYRTSFHKDLITHFEKDHFGTTRLLCHFCTKSFETKFSTQNSLNDFYRHVGKHFQLDCKYSCSRCCLIFTEEVDLNIHQAAGHNAQYLDTNAVPYKLSEAETPFSLFISLEELSSFSKKFPDLANTRTKKFEVLSRVNKGPANVELKFTIANCYWASGLFDDKPILMYSNATTKDPLKCMECKKVIYSDHFIQNTSCPLCSYSTFCKESFNKHISSETSHKRSHFSGLAVAFTVYNCVCNFYTTNGNNMALHLATSNHRCCVVGNVEDLS